MLERWNDPQHDRDRKFRMTSSTALSTARACRPVIDYATQLRDAEASSDEVEAALPR
jgi:hypothetical protein